jgi:predicted nuclease of predicted toxin-antitoxin system
MRVLLDACVWRGAGEVLRALGHEVEWAGDWSEDPGDAEILRRARDARQVLVTLDKDFGELAVVRLVPHAGIIRLVGFAARQQGDVCASLLEAYADDLSQGALLTATPGRVRVRPAGS